MTPPADRDEAVRLRPLAEADHDAVLHLNAVHVDVLSPLPRERLLRLHRWAHRFDVLEVRESGPARDGWQVAGFVVVVAPGSGYDSAKYGWFAEAYADFLYLDRIVLDARVHRRGLGTRVYDAVEADARAHGRLCLEVDVDPPNVASLAFHRHRGFTEVARLGEPGAQVSMQVKELAGEA